MKETVILKNLFNIIFLNNAFGYDNNNTQINTKFLKDIDNKIDNNDPKSGTLRGLFPQSPYSNNYDKISDNFKVRYIGYDLGI